MPGGRGARDKRQNLRVNFENFLSKIGDQLSQFFPGPWPAGSLVRVQFILVLPLILDQCGIVLSVVRVLFFPERVPAASVFFVAVGVIDLRMAIFQEASPKLWKSVGQSHVQIPRVQAMGNGA